MAEHDRIGAYRLPSPDAHRAYYDEWAATYDADFLAATGYRVPAAVARAFLDRCRPGDTPVADLGCGTGALGRELRRGDLEGFDISPGMLDQARASGAYRALHCVDLTTSAPGHRFGGVVSSGTFTVGHLGPEGLATVLGLARQQALIVIGVNAHHFEATGFDAALADLENMGTISMPDVEVIASYSGRSEDPPSPEDSTCIVAFRRLAG